MTFDRLLSPFFRRCASTLERKPKNWPKQTTFFFFVVFFSTPSSLPRCQPATATASKDGAPASPARVVYLGRNQASPFVYLEQDPATGLSFFTAHRSPPTRPLSRYLARYASPRAPLLSVFNSSVPASVDPRISNGRRCRLPNGHFSTWCSAGWRRVPLNAGGRGFEGRLHAPSVCGAYSTGHRNTTALLIGGATAAGNYTAGRVNRAAVVEGDDCRLPTCSIGPFRRSAGRRSWLFHPVHHQDPSHHYPSNTTT